MTSTTNPTFPPHIIDALAETGADWRDDADALRSGKHTRESLLAHCQDGVETEDDMALWAEYVDTLAAHCL